MQRAKKPLQVGVERLSLSDDRVAGGPHGAAPHRPGHDVDVVATARLLGGEPQHELAEGDGISRGEAEIAQDEADL